MHKALSAGMAALTFGGAVAVSALPGAADAAPYGYYYGGGDHHHHNGDAAAAAVVGGIAGLVIGSALAGGHHYNGYYGNGYYGSPYYGSGYYGSGYYGSGYGYAPGHYGYGYAPGYSGYGYAPYATCVSRRWVWDPYIGRRVLVTSRYVC